MYLNIIVLYGIVDEQNPTKQLRLCGNKSTILSVMGYHIISTGKPDRDKISIVNSYP